MLQRSPAEPRCQRELSTSRVFVSSPNQSTVFQTKRGRTCRCASGLVIFRSSIEGAYSGTFCEEGEGAGAGAAPPIGADGISCLGIAGGNRKSVGRQILGRD